MKQFTLIFILALLMASGIANAQSVVITHPLSTFPVIEDSAETAGGIWNIGATADYDTSLMFSCANTPLTGLSINLYWNDTDTGDFQFTIQGTNLYDAFQADSAYAVDGISIWSNLVTVPVVATTGRQTYIYPSTLTQECKYIRLVVGNKTSSGARTVTIYATRQN